MKKTLKIALASTAAIAIAAPAMAQYQSQYPSDQSGQYQSNGYQSNGSSQYQQPAPDYRRDDGSSDSQTSQYRPTPQYEQQQQQYQEQQQRYQEQREAYDQRRSDYDQHRQGYAEARANYQARLDAYNRARAAYDARYGYGAYVRVYGPAPVWDETHWAYYVPAAPAAGYYSAPTSYVGPAVHCDNSGAVGAGVLGALAGAVLGSNIAAHGVKTEGAVLGGVVGAGIGAAVGHAHDRYKCDTRGPYFTYNETIPYREDPHWRTPRYAEYERMHCRLASAPVDPDGRDYRYVRVCPDPNGRYRIIG